MSKQLFNRILVALNGSSSSIHAAMYAMIMTKAYHSTMKVVYVVDTATTRTLTLSKFFTADERAQYEANLISDGNNYLTYVGDLAKTKGVKVELELLKGSVWAEVVKAAEDWKADVIVLGGTEGKERNSEATYRQGNVSINHRDIIGNATCPVLVVKSADKGGNSIEKQFKAL